MLTVSVRFARLLALVLWVGGLCFFAFVLAPLAFQTLPTPHEAGLVVGGTLRVLHLLGLGCGLVLLLTSGNTGSRFKAAWARLAPWVTAALMVAITAYSQFVLLPRMEAFRQASGGNVGQEAVSSPARVGFERLHVLSERLEGAVLFGGLLLVFIEARTCGEIRSPGSDR